jgi:hypothetical protein
VPFVIQRHYQNPVILQQGCAVTVLLLDPYIDDDELWALESAANFIHPQDRTCFLLKTSICSQVLLPIQQGVEQQQQQPSTLQSDSNMDNNINNNNNHHGRHPYRIKADTILQNSKPYFRSMIEKGNVRMTELNHTRYKLKSCTNYWTPSRVWQNYHFWASASEFLPQDSDLVLTLQGDSVLCHHFHVDKWRDVAWVGAPWKKSFGPKIINYCSSLPRYWNESHSSQTQKNPPPYPTGEQICTELQHGPQGNGGFSLRSRSWLQKAIQYCPSQYSGFSKQQIASSKCKTDLAIEDVYFAFILRGIGAPLPNLFEAALFAYETDSPRQIATFYNLTDFEMGQMVRKRWYSPFDKTGMDDFRKMVRRRLPGRKDAIVSIGIHKPWHPDKADRIKEAYLNEECPYMRKIVEHYDTRSKLFNSTVKQMS